MRGDAERVTSPSLRASAPAAQRGGRRCAGLFSVHCGDPLGIGLIQTNDPAVRDLQLEGANAAVLIGVLLDDNVVSRVVKKQAGSEQIDSATAIDDLDAFAN